MPNVLLCYSYYNYIFRNVQLYRVKYLTKDKVLILYYKIQYYFKICKNKFYLGKIYHFISKYCKMIKKNQIGGERYEL